MENNLKEEFVKRGFQEAEYRNHISYKKEGMWFKRFNDFNSDKFSFGTRLSGILIQMIERAKDFKDFQQIVFEALPSRLEALNEFVKKDWTKHVYGEKPLIWALFNDAKITSFPETEIPFIVAEIKISENASIKVTFGNDGKIQKYVDFGWKEPYFMFASMMEIKKNETPEKIESRLKKYILKEFKACSDRLNEIL